MKKKFEDKLEAKEKESTRSVFFLFDKEDYEKGFNRIISSVSKQQFKTLVSNGAIKLSDLDEEKVVTYVVCNLMYENFNSGLDELWEDLAIKLKEYYGYSSKFGSINRDVKECKIFEKSSKSFIRSF